jgi:uncharacterized membrane protein
MWEENPQYQKHQMLFIGIFLLVVFVVYVIYAIAEEQWDFLKFVLSLAGALVFSMGLLLGGVWMVVKLVTCRRSKSKNEDK